MTYEEALDRCVIIRDTLMSGTDLKIVANADNIAWVTECAEAIETQIPKKPTDYTLETVSGEAVHYEGCPSCKAILHRSNYFLKICHCGQKLEV